MKAIVLLLGLAAFFHVSAEDAPAMKILPVKYVDPEMFRSLFASQSNVMEANRDLMVLTVHGSPAFLKEVEDTVKKFDVPPAAPVNIEITVYLLTKDPAAVVLPKELAAMAKEWPALRLADSQLMRVRAGQPGEASGLPPSEVAASLARVQFDSATVKQDSKAGPISVNGLRVWLNIASPDAKQKTGPDVAVNIDVAPNEAVLVSKIGIDKPVAVVLRASVVR